jgi:hypothetical protein
MSGTIGPNMFVSNEMTKNTTRIRYTSDRLLAIFYAPC